MLKKLWQSIDGKKLWSAVSIALGYGIGVARARWPSLPWDEVIIPMLLALGVVGAGHKVVKGRKPERKNSYVEN